MVIIKRSQIGQIGIRELTNREIIRPKPAPEPAFNPQPDLSAEELTVENQSSRAEEIISNVQAEASRIREQARQAGFEEGVQAGKAGAAKQIREALTVLNQAIAEREKIIKDAEGEILRISLKIAEQVIRNEVSMHPDVVMNIVADALSRVSDRESIILKVSHEDYEQLKKYKDKIAGLLDGVKNFSILEDSRIEPGGCIIETNLGYVDARISTKFTALKEAVLREYHGDLNGS